MACQSHALGYITVELSILVDFKMSGFAFPILR
jgi:hypothetical protein